jgi:hypothetical protein
VPERLCDGHDQKLSGLSPGTGAGVHVAKDARISRNGKDDSVPITPLPFADNLFTSWLRAILFSGYWGKSSSSAGMQED